MDTMTRDMLNVVWRTRLLFFDVARLHPQFLTYHDTVYLVYTAIKTVTPDTNRSQINQDCCESRCLREHPDIDLTRGLL
jgi:hypothetical protein